MSQVCLKSVEQRRDALSCSNCRILGAAELGILSPLATFPGVVEVRGVEPRSEEKILKTSTYLARLLRFTHGNSGRQDWPRAIQSRSCLWQDFARSPSKQEHAIPSYSTFFRVPMGENQENGSLNSIKRPVRSCSWHLSVYRFFNVDTETTIRSSELPHPRRIQVTPGDFYRAIPRVRDVALPNIRISAPRLNRR